MAFQLDYSDVNDGAIKDGDYEAVVFNVNEDASPSGSEYLNFDMIVRNDIEQQYKNSHIFHKVWKAKATGKYNINMIMRIAQAVGLPEGKSYNSFDDLLAEFQGKPVKVRVKNEKSEYNGKTYENLNVKRWNQSEFPNLQHQWKDNPQQNDDPFAGQGQTIDIKDEDVPF